MVNLKLTGEYMPENELQKIEQQGIMPISAFSQSFQATMSVAKSMIKSGMLPKAYTNSEQVVMAVLRAKELNIPVMMALMKGLYPVGNQFGMYGTLQLALVRRSGKMTKFTVSSEEDVEKNKSCTCVMERENKEVQQSTFSLKDAVTAGLVKPDGGWTKYLKNMLRWRSITNTIALLFSDITGGMNTPNELDPTLMVDAEVTDIVDVVQEPADIYKSAFNALQIAKKKNKIEDLEAWFGLYQEDILKLPENLRETLQREYNAATKRLQPPVQEVRSVNTVSQPNQTEPTKTASTGTQP
jgi:hypothetical protein